jgi:hypothetical protein
MPLEPATSSATNEARKAREWQQSYIPRDSTAQVRGSVCLVSLDASRGSSDMLVEGKQWFGSGDRNLKVLLRLLGHVVPGLRHATPSCDRTAPALTTS